MRREELTQTLAGFEAGHPVGDWIWNGWRVWPAVRAHLALRHHDPEVAPAPRHRLAGSLAWRRERLRRFAGEWLQRGGPPDRAADVVLLSSSDRGERLGRAFYNTVVDPWAEEVARCGGVASVWERGDPRWPSRVPRSAIQRAVDLALRAGAAPGDAPDWFGALAEFVADAFEAEVDWPELGRHLRAVETCARLFEGWLRRARPRALVLDCWYGREAMGAAMAAHALGIPVIDLQHGIQGGAHPLYAGWGKAPAGGYEVFPDRFWVWGAADAESLVASNPGAFGPEAVRVAGHRWLAAWTQRDGDPHRAALLARTERLVGGRRALLVTLQKGVPFRDALVPLVRHAPADWLWLVRPHRQMKVDPAQLEAELRDATGRAVDVRGAARLPLYALLRACAWHVTGFSTCALEALAFGVPTLLTHESGAHAYADLVARRVMWSHASPQESARRLAHGAAGVADACRAAAQRLFARPAELRGLLPEAAR
ncbi:MAG TPA: hypothetical protein VFC77_10060 [Myxococcota bacterium]|nr:hypothetical protein [Myxococcota bacterium]